MVEKRNSLDYSGGGEVILIDKDLDWTSFNVVKKVKVVLSNKFGLKKLKVGHAGTLDPLATGLVVVCTGKQTKSIERYQIQEKEYLATIRFGATTPSYDLETSVDREYPYEHIKKEDIEKALKDFEGEQDQVPPVFSAKSVMGKRAYSYARKGKSVELKSGKIHFFSLDLIYFAPPFVKIKIVCSKGTYVRAFARDLGFKLNSGAHLTALRRTRIGDFPVQQAMTIREFEEKIKRM